MGDRYEVTRMPGKDSPEGWWTPTYVPIQAATFKDCDSALNWMNDRNRASKGDHFYTRDMHTGKIVQPQE